MTQLVETKKKKLLFEMNEPNAVRYHFDSLLDMVDWLKETTIAKNHSHDIMDDNFCKQTWDEAMYSAEFGEAERVEMFSSLLEKITSMMDSEMPVLTHDVSGEILDVGAFVSGEPECFMRKLNRPAPKCVSITVDMSFVYHTHQDHIINRAVAIMALIDELQFAGHAVDFHVQFKTQGLEKSPLVVDMEIPCRPVDINTVAFVCSPAFLRRFGFSIMETYCEKNYPGWGGYGKGIPLDKPEDPGLMFVGSYCSEWNWNNWKTLESSKDHILDMLGKWQEQPEMVIVG